MSVDELGYVELQQALQGTALEPSEMHGLVTGWLCSGSSWSKTEARSALGHWLDDTSPTDALEFVAKTLADKILEQLRDSELGYRLLLPDDGADINFRRQAISDWCSGFLAGFGTSGRVQQDDLQPDVSEVFIDIARIAGLDEDMAASEENESDLLEIEEYVRMTAMMIFTDCAQQAIH